jgi:small subunit ribosomal protein S12
VARVRLTSGFEVTAYIGGIGHNLKNTLWSSSVEEELRIFPVFATTSFVEPLDTAGVKDRRQSRSKYGAKAPKE